MAELDAFSSSAMQQGAAYDALSLSKHGDGPIPAMYKLGAAALFFVEALVGMLLPVLLTAPSSSRQWALSLLNCFAGGVFLSAGLVHMVPDCQQAQRRLWPDEGGGGIPTLYLMLIALGYLLVFFVERVLLDVHGENAGHVHCEHSNVFSHSHFYLGQSSSQEDLMCMDRGCKNPKHNHQHAAQQQGQQQQQQYGNGAHGHSHSHEHHLAHAVGHAHAHIHHPDAGQQQQVGQGQGRAEGHAHGHPSHLCGKGCAHGEDDGHGHQHHAHGLGHKGKEQAQTTGMAVPPAPCGEAPVIPVLQVVVALDSNNSHSSSTPAATTTATTAVGAMSQRQHQHMHSDQHMHSGQQQQLDSSQQQLIHSGQQQHTPTLSGQQQQQPGEAGHCNGCGGSSASTQHARAALHASKRHKSARSLGGGGGTEDALSTPLLLPSTGAAGAAPGRTLSWACPEDCGGQVVPEFMPLHGAVLLGALSIHTFLECIALGSVSDLSAFWSLLIAIGSHKAISALALASRFFKEGATLKQVACYLVPFSLVAPAAIAVGTYMSSMHPLLSLVLTCLATGTFLYIGCGELTMEEFEGDVRCGRTDITARFALMIKFGAVTIGAVAIALVALLPEGDT